MDLAPQQIVVKANKLQIEQIVLNLVTNAIHALQRKSTAKKEILIKTTLSDSQSVLIVSDNGIGLPTTKPEELFNPFFATRKSGEGMGLGLAIVKMFVDRYKGEIEVTTNDQGGATFTIRFPSLLLQG
jgi:C4-dicarboxylate-specific signal transduction histidine kinase